MENKKGLKFLNNSNFVSNKAWYLCLVCNREVFRFKSNSYKVNSCGCIKNTRKVIHGGSRTNLYSRYNFITRKFKHDFKDFLDFKEWAVLNGWTENHIIVRKIKNKYAYKANLLVVPKEEAKLKYHKSVKEVCDLDKAKFTRIKNTYAFLQEMRPTEFKEVLFNMLAIYFKESLHTICNILHGDIDNKDRYYYKRAWYLLKNNKDLKNLLKWY